MRPIVLTILIALYALATPAALGVAVDKAGRLDDPKKEALARDIMKEIRCLVCQNQSIEDSNADLARDLRQVVREQVAAGKGTAEVKDYLVARYGDWILMRPPVDPRTYLLWGAPLLLLAIGGAIALATIRRRRAAAGPDDLSADEDARARALLDDVSK